MIVAVINKSTLVADGDALAMTAAVDRQVTFDFARPWDRGTDHVDFIPGGSPVPAGAAVITILDTIDNVPAGVLGYHTEGKTGPKTGFVAAAPSLNNGARVLAGDFSVSSVLSHEVLELLGDPACSLWGSDGRVYEYALELCDPVEAPAYAISLPSGTDVAVSNFVLPAWFDPDGAPPFDHLGLLNAPYTILKAGYAVRARQGGEHSVFGEQYPAWRRAAKLASPLSRTSRRRGGLAPL